MDTSFSCERVSSILQFRYASSSDPLCASMKSRRAIRMYQISKPTTEMSERKTPIVGMKNPKIPTHPREMGRARKWPLAALGGLHGAAPGTGARPCASGTCRAALQHDRAVSLECTHVPHELNIYLKPTFAQRRRNCLGYFLTLCRTVLHIRQELKLTWLPPFSTPSTHIAGWFRISLR